MRILICNFEYPPIGGGGGVVTAQLAKEMEVAVPVERIENHVGPGPDDLVDD